MIEIITQTRIFVFDGRILEALEVDGNVNRFHIAFINSVEIKSHRRGQSLSMSYSEFDRPVRYSFDDKHMAEMENLIEAIRAKIA